MNIRKQSGYLGVGGKRVIGGLGSNTALDAYIRSLSPAAWFRMDQGVTVTGAGISQVDDLSGNARHLLDPGTTRPIYLPYSGTKYLYLPGVAGNYASTPDSVANSITGDIDIRVKASFADWSPAAAHTLVAKNVGGLNQLSVIMQLGVGGVLLFYGSSNGSVYADNWRVSTSAVPFVDGADGWVRVTKNTTTGDIKFYVSDDGASWTQLGNTVSGSVYSFFNSSAAVEVGTFGAGSGNPASGKLYRAIIKNGIDGQTVVDFNPADASDGATSFASSATGETWTVNSSGALPAQIVGRASALFNGTSHYLKCNAFTLNQPTCVVMVVKQVSWTVNDVIYDGNTDGSMYLYQSATTPAVRVFAGTALAPNANLSVGSIGVHAAVYNGASSVSRLNNTTTITGACGASNAGGFALGARGGAASWSNIQVYETVIFPIAPSTAQLDRLIAGLMARHGVA